MSNINDREASNGVDEQAGRTVVDKTPVAEPKGQSSPRRTSLPQAPGAGFPTGAAVRLEEIVSYQEGSIVSRTLAKKNGGTLTLFAFDAGQSLSEHTAPFDAFVQVLEGNVELTLGGQLVPAEAGQTVLLPGGVPHAVHARERFKMLLTMLRQVE